jgi:hypothetical protein
MALVTLTRQEWSSILEALNAAQRADSPPGLKERIGSVLESTPAAWPDQACMLELADLAAVDLVFGLLQQGQMRSRETVFAWQEDASVAEAERIIRSHQNRPHTP